MFMYKTLKLQNIYKATIDKSEKKNRKIAIHWGLTFKSSMYLK